MENSETGQTIFLKFAQIQAQGCSGTLSNLDENSSSSFPVAYGRFRTYCTHVLYVHKQIIMSAPKKTQRTGSFMMLKDVSQLIKNQQKIIFQKCDKISQIFVVCLHV